MTALVTKHLPFVAAASNGISTLRELILELAIQGRLLKRERVAPSWQMLKLPEVATYRIGKTPPSKEARHWDDAGIPWVSISDMEHFSVLTETSRSVSNDMAPETFKYPPIPAGSLLMSFKLTVGKICVLGIDAYHNEAIISLRPKEGVLRDYLMRVLPSIARSGKTKDALMGATLNSASLAELTIPLPALDEQVRIVAKIDELMALCDRLEADQADAEAAHAQLVQALLDSLTQATDAADFRASWQRLSEHFHTLFTTEASIDALKQTVLQLAVRGGLTRQDSGGEPAREFVKRIAEYRSRFEASRPRRTTLPSPVVAVTAPPFLIPGGWVWVAFGAVTICRDGERIPVSQADRAGRAKVYDYYGASGIIDKIDSYLFDKPLLLIGEDGANLINRATPIAFIAKGKYWVNNHAHVIDGISDGFLQYIALYINAIDLKPYVTGTAQPKMNQAKLNGIPVPIPPESEQHRIVAKVNELLALCDQLKTQLADARDVHAKLATALVEQAVA